MGGLVYRRDLFDASTVERWGRWFLAVLAGLVDDLDRPLSDVSVLTGAERAALVDAGTGPSLPPGSPRTVVDAVLEHARTRPQAVATADDGGTLTYAALEEWSLGAAHAIGAAVSGDERVIGVCLPRDRYLPAALLAVLRNGLAYLPLDPGDPPARLAALAADAGVRVVVARGDALAVARSIPGLAVVDLDADAVQDENPCVGPPPEAQAYLLYTSGSTGQPKAVEVTHANLAAYAAAMRARPGVTASDTVLALAPLTFDGSAGEIWAALAAGARCHVLSRASAVDGHLLAELIAESGATAMLASATTLRLLQAAGWAGDPKLRVWTGGEPVDPALARDVLGRVGELWNVYGPTEATIISVAQRVRAVSGRSVPIGTAMAGEWLYVVDRRGRLALPGVIGELWIGGAGVTRGYRRRADLTATAFAPDPERVGGTCYRTGDLVRWRSDGVLECLGRRDQQVKVRGTASSSARSRLPCSARATCGRRRSCSAGAAATVTSSRTSLRPRSKRPFCSARSSDGFPATSFRIAGSRSIGCRCSRAARSTAARSPSPPRGPTPARRAR